MMNKRQRRQFYVGLAVLILALFTAGIVAGFAQRNDKLCRDGKPPSQQQDLGLGQIKYLCHDGQIVKR
jgi:hypothetical protein